MTGLRGKDWVARDGLVRGKDWCVERTGAWDGQGKREWQTRLSFPRRRESPTIFFDVAFLDSRLRGNDWASRE